MKKVNPKRNIQNLVLNELNNLCQKCRENIITNDDVFCIDDKCNSLGKVYALCKSCMADPMNIRPSSEVINKIKNDNIISNNSNRPFEVKKITKNIVGESDRAEKTNKKEREEWNDWTHLERRIKMRLLTNSSKEEIKSFIDDVINILNKYIPSHVIIDGRGTILINIEDFGGLLLSARNNGILEFSTWFPENLAWKSRISTSDYATKIEKDVVGKINEYKKYDEELKILSRVLNKLIKHGSTISS